MEAPVEIKFERRLVFEDDDFPLEVATWKDHPEYPPHVHDFSAIVIIFGGSGEKIINHESFRVQTGDVFVLHGNRPHGFRETEQLEVGNVIFDRQLLDIQKLDILSLPGYQALFEVRSALHGVATVKRHLQLNFRELARVRALTDMMEIELHSVAGGRAARKFEEREQAVPSGKRIDEGSRLIALGHFMVLVGLLSRWYARHPVQDSQHASKIGKVLDFLETHYAEDIEMDKLASMAFMSRRNFYRVFNEVTRQSPMVYLTKLRLAKAAHLLQTTDKNVTETAFACGFTDSNYFSRRFRKLMGVGPREYKSNTGMVPGG